MCRTMQRPTPNQVCCMCRPPPWFPLLRSCQTIYNSMQQRLTIRIRYKRLTLELGCRTRLSRSKILVVIFSIMIPTRGFISQVVSSEVGHFEPISHLDDLHSPCWQHAMQEEFDALIQNNTWKLVPPKPGRNLVDYKWIFKIRRHANGSIERHKVRLVAKGFNQCYGLDYA
jgi:hypothetical protein